jgi:transposase
VCQRAAELNINLIRLPAYSPDFMPVEALWRWLREDVTYHRCHTTGEGLIAHIEQFRQTIRRLTPIRMK